MTAKAIVFTHPSGKAAHVKLGFCWPAFLLGPAWALLKRLWLHLVALIAVLLPIVYLDGYAEHTRSLILNLIALALYIGYMVVCGRYGNYWLRSALIKKGYRAVGGCADA